MEREEFIKILPAYVGNDAKSLTGETLKIDEITHKGNMISYNTDRVFFAAVGEYKLLLRRVEDMTKNERTQLEKHMDWYDFVVKDFIRNPNEFCMIRNYTTASKLIRYLNRIGVDTDNLLSTEWAELKTNK